MRCLCTGTARKLSLPGVYVAFAVLLPVACLILPRPVSGQSRDAPEFEVASVKAVQKMPRQGGQFSCRAGRLTSRGMPAKYAVLWAWHLEDHPDRLIGVPAWAQSAGAGDITYDIDARLGGDSDEDQCRLMLRTLLKVRFHLQVHEENRQADVYELVIAKSGARLKQVTDPNALPNGPGFRPNGRPTQVFDDRDLKGWSMDQLAQALSMPFVGLERPVLNRTNLKGIYRIDLTYRGTSDGDGPDIHTAVRSQLGLELSPARAMLTYVIVDHLQRPDPN